MICSTKGILHFIFDGLGRYIFSTTRFEQFFFRSVILRYLLSSKTPISPVCSQPSMIVSGRQVGAFIITHHHTGPFHAYLPIRLQLHFLSFDREAYCSEFGAAFFRQLTLMTGLFSVGPYLHRWEWAALNIRNSFTWQAAPPVMMKSMLFPMLPSTY